MPATAHRIDVDWGATGKASVANGGDGSLYYRVLDSANAALVARTNLGIAENPAGSGQYYATGVSWDDSAYARIVWDDGTDWAPEVRDPALVATVRNITDEERIVYDTEGG